MVRVLDTAATPATQRLDQVDAAVRQARLPATLRPLGAPPDFHATVDVWDSGHGREFLHWTSAPYRIWRGAADVRAGGEHRVALTAVGPGRWSHHHAGDDRVVDARGWDLLLIDHTGEYDFRQNCDGTTYAFNVDIGDLGLSPDDVRRAIPRVPAAPLRHLVVQHVVGAARALDAGLSDAARDSLGAATVDLMRALVTSALDPETGTAPADDTLLLRSRMYVDQHLGDPTLSPGRIARALGVSPRRLYRAWEDAEVTLAEYTRGRRLEAAAAMLAGPPPTGDAHGETPGTDPIAVIARRCGFVDMSHFARRFRDAYGMSPRQWRALANSDHSRGDMP